MSTTATQKDSSPFIIVTPHCQSHVDLIISIAMTVPDYISYDCADLSTPAPTPAPTPTNAILNALDAMVGVSVTPGDCIAMAMAMACSETIWPHPCIDTPDKWHAHGWIGRSSNISLASHRPFFAFLYPHLLTDSDTDTACTHRCCATDARPYPYPIQSL